MSKENFLDWHEPLRRDLIANDLDILLKNKQILKL